jgi:hypothetical protein
MARPTKSERRDRQLNLKLTLRELAWLRARAARSSMSLVDYGRAQLLADRPLRSRPLPGTNRLDPLFVAQVSRIGNNLNQIARRMNGLDIPPPPELVPLLDTIRDLIRAGARRGP